MYVARMMIANFLDGGVFSADLRSCRIHGTALIEALDKVISNTEDRELSIFEIYPITNAFAQFRTAMLAEIGVLPSFFVTQKGGFHTITLLDQGEKLFPDDLHQKAPEAIFDIKQAAMSLAYELATAAGFHAFRATESVLRRYYTHVSGGQPLPKVRNIGVYIRGLRKANCGDETILASLEQLRRVCKGHSQSLIMPMMTIA
jgi:hypothetical protein